MHAEKCEILTAHMSNALLPDALRLIRAGATLGLDVDAHIFGRARHGFALRDLEGTEAVWPELAQKWIDRRLARDPR